MQCTSTTPHLNTCHHFHCQLETQPHTQRCKPNSSHQTVPLHSSNNDAVRRGAAQLEQSWLTTIQEGQQLGQDGTQQHVAQQLQKVRVEQTTTPARASEMHTMQWSARTRHSLMRYTSCNMCVSTQQQPTNHKPLQLQQLKAAMKAVQARQAHLKKL